MSHKLDEAWAEFKERNTEENGAHVSTFEAKEFLKDLFGKGQKAHGQRRASARLSKDDEEKGRFLDWLLHTKRDKDLAYQWLQNVGSVTVGPRQYWATTQQGRRAIGWESDYTYPGTDSEVWDIIMVD